MIDISIVVPVYNAEDTLKPCLDALLAQSADNIEIIAVDDGSTDASGAMLDEAAKRDSRLHVIHQQNKGRWQARLVAIQASQGRYIGSCDADDVASPGLYSTLLALADETDAGVAVCPYRRIESETGRVIAIEMMARKGIFSPAADPRGFACTNPAMWNKLILGNALRSAANGLCFSTAPRVMEDMLLFTACLPWINTIAYTDVPMYDYMMRAGGVMATLKLDEIESLTSALHTVRDWVGNNDRGGKLQAVVDVMAFAHLGVSALTNLIRSPSGDAAVYARGLRRMLASEFPGYWGRGHNSGAGPTGAARLRLAVALVMFRCHALVPGLRAYNALGRLLGREGRW